jgi:hypothetical protein
MDEVIIVEYDPHWPTLFEAEAARIWQVLGNIDFCKSRFLLHYICVYPRSSVFICG